MGVADTFAMEAGSARRVRSQRWVRRVAGVALTCAAGAVFASAAAFAPAASTRVVPAGFEPWSASFVSAARGFALGTDGCNWVGVANIRAGCQAIIATTADAGARWQMLEVPPVTLNPTNETPGSVTSITFADSSNGWLSGAGLWATHDGGHHWAQIHFPGVPLRTWLGNVVTDGKWSYVTLSTSSGKTVSTIRLGVTLLRSPIGTNDWKPVPGQLPTPGKQLADQVSDEGLVALDGSAWLGLGWRGGYGVWEVRENRPVTYRSDPCRLAGANHGGIGSIAASSSSYIVVSCFPGALISSSDGGRRFVRVPAPHGDGVIGGVNLMASPLGRPDTIVMAYPSNFGFAVPFSKHSSWIDRTVDDGRTWKRTYYKDNTAGWADLQFESAADGWVVHGYPGASVDQLMRTTNAGATFTPATF